MLPAAPSLVVCKGPCGRSFSHLGRHLGRSEICRAQYYTSYDDEEDIEASADQRAESATVMDEHYQAILDQQVFNELSELYFKGMMGEAELANVRAAVTGWNALSLQHISVDLADVIDDPSNVREVMDLIAKRTNTFKHLNSEYRLIKHAFRTLPVLRVVENIVGPGAEDRTYGCLILDWIVLLMCHSVKQRRHMVAKSDLWLSGAKAQETKVWSDWDDGLGFKPHPFAQAAPRLDPVLNIPVLLIGVMMGYDDLELLNVLGVARGKKKQACVYGAIANLPSEDRFDHDNMAMIMVCSQKTLVKLDPVRVFAGADPVTGVPVPEDWASPGAQFRVGAEGQRARVPLTDDSNNLEDVLIKFMLIDASCDYLAKTLLSPTMTSTGAHKYCPDCDFDKRAEDCDKPFSFLQGCCIAHNHRIASHRIASHRIASHRIARIAHLASHASRRTPRIASHASYRTPRITRFARLASHASHASHCRCMGAAPAADVQKKWKLRTLNTIDKHLNHAWDVIKSKKKRDKFLARKGYRCKGVLGVGTHVHTAHPDVYHFSHECPPISAILSSLHRSSMLFIKLSFLATILR
jgi:hypothetical protein